MSAKSLDAHGRWRSVIVAFRVSPEEDLQLERMVQLTGLTKQEYIISRLLGRDVVVQGNLRVYQALKENLAAVLSELNRICPGEKVPDDLLDTIRFTNGCPAIYSTAEITVRNSECVSEQSRALIIEGMNSVTLENVTIEGNDQSTKSGSIHANVLLYQSTSGDAKEGTSVFSMTGGTMTSHSGAMFYCTNTASVINLNDAVLNLSEDGTLLIVSAGRWGKDGRNGGRCTLNAEHQTLTGSITVDSISMLSINMTESDFTGSINTEQEGGTVHVTMDEGSSWTLTADSYVTSLSGDMQNIHANGYRLFVDGAEIL